MEWIAQFPEWGTYEVSTYVLRALLWEDGGVMLHMGIRLTFAVSISNGHA